MKSKIVLIALFSVFCMTSFAQVGVGVNHASRSSFFNINYKIGKRFLPEVRVATEKMINSFSPSLILNYIVKQNEDMELYAGVGAGWSGPYGAEGSVPIGLNLYPFKNKRIGFNMELKGVFGLGGNYYRYSVFPRYDRWAYRGNYLQSSIGLRYRFGKK